MFAKINLSLLAMAMVLVNVSAQSPAPLVVQAATQVVAPAATAAVAPANSGEALKTLQDIKTANEEVLRQQAATLLQLEEMEKAAEQIKVYTKRG